MDDESLHPDEFWNIALPEDRMSNTSIHYRACNLCEAICGIEIKLENGRITGIRGDKEDPFSRGHICPKAPELKTIYEDPDRIKFPLRKTKSGWEEISWQEALTETAQKLHEIQKLFGNDAVGVYQGNPSVHNYGSLLLGSRFTGKLKTKNVYSATSVDQLPHYFASYFMLGHFFLLPVPDIDRTEYFLIMGGNPLASNGSMMTAPDIKNRLKDIQNRGGKFIVIDPRKTETAELADRHLFIRPATDVFFLFALLNALFEMGYPKNEFPEWMKGRIEELRKAAAPYSPESTEKLTGIPAAETRKIASEFASSGASVCYGRVGLSTQPFGALCQWLIYALNTVTGNLDRPGGAMFTKPAFDTVGSPRKGASGGSYNTYRTKARNLPEFAGEFPSAALADEILYEGEGKIRALVTSCGNPVLSTPNGRKLEKAFEKLDFMVSVDFYINETTKHAHIILPPTSSLEHDHYDFAFHLLAVRNTAKYSQPLFEKPANTKHDWEIFSELTKRIELLRAGQSIPDKFEHKLTPKGMLEHALRSGPQSAHVSLQTLIDNPHGIDLGPLESCLPDRLFTEDRKVNLAPEIFLKDLPRLEAYRQEIAGENGNKKFLLIGRRHLRNNNSWMHNSEKLMAGKERCTLFIHPEDAGHLGIESNQRVTVKSRVGEVTLQAEVTDDIMKGVVSIPHGFGHNRNGTRIKTAQAHAGVSINDLTDDEAIDAVSGNAAFSALPVEIHKT